MIETEARRFQYFYYHEIVWPTTQHILNPIQAVSLLSFLTWNNKLSFSVAFILSVTETWTVSLCQQACSYTDLYFYENENSTSGVLHLHHWNYKQKLRAKLKRTKQCSKQTWL